MSSLEEPIKEGLKLDLFVGRLHSPQEADVLERYRVPLISLDPMPEHPWIIPSYVLDLENAGRLAAEHLLNKGHRHFTYYSKTAYAKDSRMWQGFRDRLMGTATSLTWIIRDEERILDVLPTEKEHKYVTMTQWLQHMPRPMALYLPSDHLCSNICQLAWRNDISIPEDMAILGQYNHEMICTSVEPALSSIAFPGETWGYQVAQQVDSILKGAPQPELAPISPQQVVERGSTELMALEDPIVAKGLSLIRLNAADRLPLSEILKPLPLSSRSFGIRFQQALGRSPQEELFRQRVELARKLLLETNFTVDHIADDSGFRNSESMSQHFKKWVGMTPTAFRKQNRL